MKTKTLSQLTIATVCCVLLANAAYGQVPQLAIITIPDTTSMLMNPDSIAVDTNSLSTTFGQQYACEWYVIRFDTAVFDLPSSYLDTATYLTWRDIDTAYSSLRSHLDSMETLFGSFHMENVTNLYDSTKSYNFKPRANQNTFYLKFDSGTYNCVDSVVMAFSSSPSSSAVVWYQHRYYIMAYVPNDRALLPGTPYPDIVWVYNGDRNNEDADEVEFWSTHFHRLGWHWNHWVQKSVMAWEITKGHSGVTIAISDIFEGPISEHPDMENFKVLQRTEPQSIETHPMRGDNEGDGDHGISVASAAMATGDNDGPTLDGVGMLGTCFNCVGVGVTAAAVPWVDADGTVDGEITRVDVVTSSSTSGGKETWRRAIDMGIVASRAGGNHRDDYKQSDTWDGKTIFPWGEYREYTNANGEKVGVFYNSPRSWANYTYPDPNDPSNPTKDTKIIAVGAIIDGQLESCDESYDFANRETEPYMSGGEQFHPVYNFGPGKEKFAVDTDPKLRIPKKEAAWMDIVVPTGFVTAHDGQPATEAYNQKYHPYNEGTSQANPSLAGVVGLMLAINPKMGKQGRAVQRAVYDAITFTADKIPDELNYPTGEQDARWINDDQYDHLPRKSRYSDVNTSLTNLGTDGTAIQFAYVEQTNDPLKRWWAQRMGFGRLNAYRAVAHAISLKAPRVWSTSQSVFFDFSSPPLNEDGFNLMHMGAYNMNDDLVLEHGGEDFPGESYNNQGVTYVNGTGTTLTVPQNSILAVDGLLKTTNSTGNNTIETQDNGKILLTGYLEDVEVVGNLRVDDLTINGTSSSATSCIAIGSATNSVEIYGDVVLSNYGMINANLGSMDLMPGSSVRLNGSTDLVIKDGATVTMHAESEISSNSDNEITVENGSTLILKSGARMKVGVHINVKSGGTLIIDEGAVASIASFNVERDGEIQIKKGVQLSLTSPIENVVNGRFVSTGGTSERIRITGEVEDCCTRICTTAVDYALIRIEDDMSNPSSNSECYANIRFTDVSNVPITTMNAPLYHVWNCDFSADREILDDLPKKTLLSIILTDETTINSAYSSAGSFPRRDGVWIISCSFFDEAGDFGKTRGTYTHEITGVSITRMNRAVVNNSDFSFMKVGVNTTACDSTAIQYSDFQVGDIGIQDDRSILRICSNQFDEVEFGVIMTGSAPSWIFSNQYDQGSSHLNALNSRTSHYIRGNTFKDYSNVGIDLSWTSGRLDEAAIARNGPLYSKWGRNHFELPGTPIFPTGASNSTYDVYMRDQFANVSLVCGYNQFAEASSFHLGSQIPKNAYVVSGNEFLDPTGHAVRTQNILWQGTPINTSATLNDCGSVTGTYCGSNSVWPQFDGIDVHFVSDGGWVDLSPTELYLDTAFTTSVSEFQQDTINDEPRMLKMRNAVEAARLGNSISADFATLETALKQLIADTNESDQLRFATQMTLGELFDIAGNTELAHEQYDSAVISFPGFDSLATAWVRMRSSMEVEDPTFGAEFDSLQSKFTSTVIDDLRNRYDYTGLPRRPFPQATEREAPIEIDLTENASANRDAVFLAEIQKDDLRRSSIVSDFYVPNRRRVIATIISGKGTEAMILLNEIVDRGKHRIQADVAALDAGYYILSVTTGNSTWSRPFLVR